eukprot:CAMPEP_0115551288 /NCGR_PEP_ID=MMETSP0271-20121206/95656_1 /TAXON_ID=71861 /ORGANISM="Scrippsiella trochoidea, Strain CCMP3099" /LENGTH=216 /DNA_ID=CAMNT_0002984889 /DNA_START=42 /DNA_END=689 /DNA_ORIENTATION=-
MAAADSDEAKESDPLVPKAAGPPYIFLAVLGAIYVGIGVAVGMLSEGWRFLTSVYVVAQIITTVGYGDFTVTTASMKLFCAFYVISLLAMGAYFINIAVDTMNSRNAHFLTSRLCDIEMMMTVKSSLRGSKCWGLAQVVEKFERYNDLIVASALMFICMLAGTVFYATYEACSCSYGKSFVEGCIPDSYEQCARSGGELDDFFLHVSDYADDCRLW